VPGFGNSVFHHPVKGAQSSKVKSEKWSIRHTGSDMSNCVFLVSLVDLGRAPGSHLQMSYSRLFGLFS
jgi:hypothetical protein